MTPPIDDITAHLKRILSRRGINAQDTDDLIQEALLKLEVYGRKTEVENVKGFLARTVINLSIDLHRRESGAPRAPKSVENYEIADKLPQPDEVLASRQRLQRLSEGFDALDSLTADLVRAQRVEGLPVRAIAKRHRLSVSAVEKRLAKGMSFLLEWMKGW